MSSVSSLVTTAASDSSSSADSPYCTSTAAAAGQRLPQSARRRSYHLKARGVVIAKGSGAGAGGNQKVFCVCKVCKGERMVSKSTCYRHLRTEAEIAEDDAKWEARWGPAHPTFPSQEQIPDSDVAKEIAASKHERVLVQNRPAIWVGFRAF